MPTTANIAIDKFRGGSQSAFKNLYDKYYEALFLFGQKYIPNSDVVEDLVQESFIKVWEKKSSFFHEAALKAYLYKTVRNACLNYLDHQKVERNYESQSKEDVLSEDYFLNNVIDEEVNRIIAETVNKLPESARIIYLLSLKGLKNAEIAEDLNISINTVKTQKQRASKFLKENLKDLFTMLLFL
ncbi:RNA polymerase sigma-70 factor [Marinifilum caeruleilacunae]|uniref:RNA polymerase sigma-70 factor n=1 Tax=Marinifilum caeruleilacunae TaxID=2499076 RepID=A0ABX1WXU1_9BACT|nr:RNA polymerase sigma-70 factor [Marinifilum caeruleilacunae]NOU60857.1 RNA polymerase sigma-70 factor [Marinifilum caeruleilacunae]